MVSEEYQPEERETGPPQRQEAPSRGSQPTMSPQELEEYERRLGETSKEIPVPEDDDEDVEATRAPDRQHSDVPPTTPAPPPESQ
jgi:hypothetical protein